MVGGQWAAHGRPTTRDGKKGVPKERLGEEGETKPRAWGTTVGSGGQAVVIYRNK